MVRPPWLGGPLARGGLPQPQPLPGRGRTLPGGALGRGGPWFGGRGPSLWGCCWVGRPWPGAWGPFRPNVFGKGGPLARGALGGWWGTQKPATLNRVWRPALWARKRATGLPRPPHEPSGPGIQAARGRGPRQGGPANPEPKILNHVQTQWVILWGYTLATLKVVWVPAIPKPSTDVVVKKADVRWPVQDRR